MSAQRAVTEDRAALLGSRRAQVERISETMVRPSHGPTVTANEEVLRRGYAAALRCSCGTALSQASISRSNGCGVVEATPRTSALPSQYLPPAHW
jgi:hypothetical protein